MRQVIGVALLVMVVACLGCEVRNRKSQTINIDYYEEIEENLRLAEALSHYDPQYFTKDIAAYNGDTESGISFAFDFDASEGKAVFWVLYSMENEAVSDNLPELTEGFSKAIEQLQADHLAMQSVFENLSPVAQAWIELVFDRSGGLKLTETSTLMQTSLTPGQWEEICAGAQRDLGTPLHIGFLGGQFYRAFREGIPESISLFFSVKFRGDNELEFRVSLTQQNGEWKLMGIKWYPRATA